MNRRRRPSVCALLTRAFLLVALFWPVTSSSAYPFAVVGYLPEWRYEGADWVTLSRTITHLILFSLEVTQEGRLGALDRIPRSALLAKARAAADASGTKLMMCVGGNGRSAGFGPMVQSGKARKAFVKSLLGLCNDKGFDGVDLNWEYPGYVFGRGYDEAETKTHYAGFYKLVPMLRKAFDKAGLVLTMAYYPDGRQEEMLVKGGVHTSMDLLHMMSYDQGGRHSTLEFGKSAVDQGVRIFPKEARAKLTMGVPFYARNVRTGEWTTYEDIVQRHHPLDLGEDEVTDSKDGAVHYFNGVHTIAAKVEYAIQAGIGGVMIWEAGQDCRQTEVKHDESNKHVVTCPEGDTRRSLLNAIQDKIDAYKNASNHGGDEL